MRAAQRWAAPNLCDQSIREKAPASAGSPREEEGSGKIVTCGSIAGLGPPWKLGADVSGSSLKHMELSCPFRDGIDYSLAPRVLIGRAGMVFFGFFMRTPYSK